MVCRIGLELRSSRADAPTFLSEVSSVFMGYIFVTREYKGFDDNSIIGTLS